MLLPSSSSYCCCLWRRAVPGYYFTVAFVEKLGRKTIQYMGFIMMTILLVIIAAAWVPLKAHAVWALVVIYALTFFFANFGPNSTTFIIPGEAFPTRWVVLPQMVLRFGVCHPALASYSACACLCGGRVLKESSRQTPLS